MCQYVTNDLCAVYAALFKSWDVMYMENHMWWKVCTHGTVLFHHSPRWLSLTSGQDLLYSDGDPCVYMQHCLLQTLAISTPGLITLPIHFTSSQILLLSELNHSWATSSAHPHQPSSIMSVHLRAGLTPWFLSFMSSSGM